MIKTAETRQQRTTARELLGFLDELMRAIARVDLGDPGVAQLTLIELRILLALGDSSHAMEIRELAAATETSNGETDQACYGLRSRKLVERAGGGRGPERAIRVSSRGRRLLASLRSSRQAAVEGFIAGLSEPERLRIDGAAHLLGGELERLSRGMLPA